MRNALLIAQVPGGPTERYLMPGPRLPLTSGAGDGTVTFDGDRVRLEWNWLTEDVKKSAGPQQFALADVASVEWAPCIGMENGYLRFRLHGHAVHLSPKHDPYCLTWGIRREAHTHPRRRRPVAARHRNTGG